MLKQIIMPCVNKKSNHSSVKKKDLHHILKEARLGILKGQKEFHSTILEEQQTENKSEMKSWLIDAKFLIFF